MIRDDKDSHALRVMIGWSDGINGKDAVNLARGFAQRRFDAVDSAWYAVAPFIGGYLWEVQEGGPGRSYIPAVVTALSEDPGGSHWFPSGDRVFRLMMRDGKPLGLLLSGEESKTVLASADEPIQPNGRMTRVVSRGTGVAVMGAVLFGTSLSTLLASMTFFWLAANPGPAIHDVRMEDIPQARWSMVADTPNTEVITRLRFDGTNWSVERRPHLIEGVNQPAAPSAKPDIPEPPPSSTSSYPRSPAAERIGAGPVPTASTTPPPHASTLPVPMPRADSPTSSSQLPMTTARPSPPKVAIFPGTNRMIPQSGPSLSIRTPSGPDERGGPNPSVQTDDAVRAMPITAPAASSAYSRALSIGGAPPPPPQGAAPPLGLYRDDGPAGGPAASFSADPHPRPINLPPHRPARADAAAPTPTVTEDRK